MDPENQTPEAHAVNVEAEIARIAESMTDRASIQEALTNLLGVSPDWTGLHWWQNLVISVSDAGDEDDGFRWLRELDISAAPEQVTFRARGGEYEIIILRYWICPGERLLPLAQANIKLSEAARHRFRSDMERLFDQGKLFPYIRGDAHWYVSDGTGAIVLWPWELKDARARDRDEYFEAMERTFARYT